MKYNSINDNPIIRQRKRKKNVFFFFSQWPVKNFFPHGGKLNVFFSASKIFLGIKFFFKIFFWGGVGFPAKSLFFHAFAPEKKTAKSF